MFAATPGELYRETFSQPSRFSELIPAQPRCIFGNGDDTETARSGARSKRVRWVLISRPWFREPVVAGVSLGPVGHGSPEEAKGADGQRLGRHRWTAVAMLALVRACRRVWFSLSKRYAWPMPPNANICTERRLDLRASFPRPGGYRAQASHAYARMRTPRS